jgi:hypothetical protein
VGRDQRQGQPCPAKDLERDGLIKISYGTIEVPDRARLTARA